jgi:hypothetical protein
MLVLDEVKYQHNLQILFCLYDLSDYHVHGNIAANICMNSIRNVC